MANGLGLGTTEDGIVADGLAGPQDRVAQAIQLPKSETSHPSSGLSLDDAGGKWQRNEEGRDREVPSLLNEATLNGTPPTGS